MIRVLRRRLLTALLAAALMSLSIASPVLPHLAGLGGEAHAEHCGGSGS